MEDLNAARELLMRRLIFSTAKCQKPYTESHREGDDNSVSYLRHEFAVLVNTGNTEISGQFARAFEMAERFLTEGTNFRITVFFDYSYILCSYN